MLGTILVIILILFLVGALPTWPHSQSWGYAPSGVLGTILIIVLIVPPWATLGLIHHSRIERSSTIS
jgi:fumarate reductase subunit D